MADGILALNPRSYWAFPELTGVNAANAAGGTRAVLANGAAFTASGAQGRGVALDGVNDLVSVNHSAAYALNSGAISLWFNPTALGRAQGLVSKNSQGLDAGGGFSVILQADGTLLFQLESTTTTFTIQSSAVATAGAWNNVVLSWGAGGMQLWLNGAQVGANAYTGGLGTSSGGTGTDDPLVFGANTQNAGDVSLGGASDFFGGSIDEAVVLSRQPTAAEIAAINLNGSIVGNANPVAGADALAVLENGANPFVGNVLINDIDANGDGLSVFAVRGDTTRVGTAIAGTYGVLTMNADGSYAYVLNSSQTNVQALRVGQTLTETFAYTASDGRGGLSTANLVVTINGQNDAPTVTADARTIQEDAASATTAAANVLTNDRDPDGGILTVTAVNGSGAGVGAAVSGTYGAITIAATGAYTYTLNNASPLVQALKVGQSVTDTFSYSVSDGQGGVSTANVVVTVTGRNDGPTVVSETNVITSGAPPVVGNVLANDSDIEGDAISVSAVRNSAANVGAPVNGTYGTLVLNADGTYTYSVNPALTAVINLAPGATAIDSFTYTVRDANGLAGPLGTLAITVIGTNDGPQAVNDARTIQEDAASATTAAANVLSNDSDPDGGILTVTAVNGSGAGVGAAVSGTYGSLTMGGDGAYTYTLNNASPLVQALKVGQSVTDTFSYSVSDGQGGVSTANVVVTVTGRNDGPTVVSETNVITSGAPPVVGNVLANDSDIEGDAISVSAVRNSAANVGAPVNGTYGTLVLNADGTYTYSVNPALTAVINLAPGATAIDSFTYTVRDANGSTGPQGTLAITVVGTNDGPQAVNDARTIQEDAASATTAAANVLSNDSDPDGGILTVTAVNGSGAGVGAAVSGTYGSLTMGGDGAYTYTLNNASPLVQALRVGQSITDTFSYTISDGQGGEATASVIVTVTGRNDTPTVVAQATGATTEDIATTTSGSILGSLTDRDAGDTLTVNQVRGAATNVGVAVNGVYGVLILNSDGTYTYTLNNAAPNVQALTHGQTVTDSFLFRANDSAGANVTNTLVITVVGRDENYAPITNADVVSGTEDIAATFDVRTNDTDPDGDALTVTHIGGVTVSTGLSVALAGGHTAALNADGTITVTAAANHVGDISFAYTISDGRGGTAVAQATVTFASVNDAPQLVTPILDQAAVEDAAFAFTVPAGTFADVDLGDTLTYSGSLANGDPLPSWLTFDALTQTFSGTPTDSDVGMLSLRVTVTDGSGAIASDTFDVAIAGVTSVATITFGDAVRVLGVERVSTTATGEEGLGATGGAAVFSSDGTRVVFFSSATNLVPDDTNGGADVFIKNLVTGAITRVSTDANGNPSNQVGQIQGGVPIFSADGTKVAFYSAATNLVPGDTNGAVDLFVKDLITGEIIRASTDSDGAQSNNTTLGSPIWSPDGTKLMFTSLASNLVPGDTNNAYDVFIKDFVTGETTRISTTSAGVQSPGQSFILGSSSPPRFSPDGTKVVFENGGALLPGDTNNTIDIYLKELSTGVVSRVSTNAAEAGANSFNFNPTFSPDGTKVMFWSGASNLIADDTNGQIDVFVKDLVTGAVTFVSSGASGVQGNGFSVQAEWLPDGRVLFQSAASNLTPGDSNGVVDVFIKDLTTGAISILSTNASGVASDGSSAVPLSSYDGQSVSFQSNASNLVPGDTNAASDLFVAKIATPFRGIENGQVIVPITIAPAEAGESVTQVVLSGLPEGSTLSAGTSSDNGITWTIAGSAPANLSMTPPVGYTGAFTLTVSATTSQGSASSTTTAAVGVTVTPINHAPVATDIADAVNEDSSVVLDVSSRANDPDGSAINLVRVDGKSIYQGHPVAVAGGVVSLNIDGTFSVTPTPNSTVPVTFSYTVSDGFLLATANARIDVTPLPDAPIAHDDAATTTEDTPVTIDVLSNDTDADGDALTITEIDGQPVAAGGSVSLSSGGQATLNGDGTITYTPGANASGVELFGYTIDDGNGGSAPGSVSVTVDPAAAAPSIVFGNTVRVETVERVSVAVDGAEGNGITGGTAIFSSDGTRVVFASSASNLVPNDTNGFTDVFVKNLVTGDVSLVSTTASGAQSDQNNSPSFAVPTFSPDGNKVAFFSNATNLVADDSNGVADIFVKDLVTGAITLVSRNASGVQGNGASIGTPIFSPDGTKLMFTSQATNFSPGDTNNQYDVYIKDLTSGEITLVSTNEGGVAGGGSAFVPGTSSPPRFNADGTKVVFESGSPLTAPGTDTNNTFDIFVKDLTSGLVTRVSTDGAGGQANSFSFNPTFSPDGTKVMFWSGASNLVAGDLNNAFDVFVKDLLTDEVTLVSADSNGVYGNSGTTGAQWSFDGRYVIFSSASSNLVPGDTNGVPDVFTKDLFTGAVSRLSTTPDGVQTNGGSGIPLFSYDGASISFNSVATNLVPGDTNAATDLFVAKILQPFRGNEDGKIGLPIAVAPAEAGEAVTQVVIAGLPAGSVLSAGVSSDGGVTWTFSGPPPADLTLTPPVNYAGEFTLTITATSTQGSATATSTATRAVVVTPVADAAAIIFDGLAPIDAADVQVNTQTAEIQAHSVVTALHDGGYVVAWTSVVSPAGGLPFFSITDVYMQRYDASGATVGGQVRVNSTAPGVTNQSAPSIATLADGSFVVTWTLYTGATNESEVWARRFNADGTAAAPDFPVTVPFTPGLDGLTTVSALPDGGYLIAWEERNGTDTDVAMQRYSATNAPVGGRVQVTQDGINDVHNQFVDLVVLNDGSFIAAWSSSPEANFDDLGRIYIRRFDSAGAPLADAVALTSDSLHDEGMPAMAALADGGFVISFTSFQREGAENGVDVYIQRFDASGARVGGETLAYANPAGGQGYSTVAALADGGFVVSYVSGFGVLNDGIATGTEDLFAQRFDAAGNRVGEPVRINATTAGTQWTESFTSDPVFAVTPDGVLVHTFYGDGEIHLRRFDTNVFAGKEDGAINLPIAVTPVAGETVTQVVLSGLPAGSVLSAGSSNGDGTAWTFAGAPPETLRLSPPANYNGSFTLTVTATTQQGATSATSTSSTSVTVSAVNDVPQLVTPLPDQTATEDAAFSFAVPAGAFAEVDFGDVLTYTATLVNGDPLPSWLSFDALTRTFSGTPGNDDVATFDVRVTATDSAGQRASDDFTLSVGGLATPAVISFSDELTPGPAYNASTSTAGGIGNNWSYFTPAISAEGRYVAFLSDATNLVTGDTNQRTDIFRKDILTGDIIRASTDGTGAESNGAPNNAGSPPTSQPSISADGRYVMFTSNSTNFVAGDDAFPDIFLKDLQTEAITRLSNSTTGGNSNGSSGEGTMSADGRFVVFHSFANNLVVGDGNAAADIFRYDVQSGTLSRISTNAAGEQSTGGNSTIASISADGRFVAFQSLASNLVTGDTNGIVDIFVKDMQTGIVTRVSEGADGTQSNGFSDVLSNSISGDGRYVVFRSGASNLVANDTNGVDDVFIKDLSTGAIQRLSVNAAGVQGNGTSAFAYISTDGRYVTFDSSANNLVVGDANGQNDVFVRDLVTGSISRISGATDGAGGNGYSGNGVLSDNGRQVAFFSFASNIVTGDNNAVPDVFVRNLYKPFQGTEEGVIGLPIRVTPGEAGETVMQVVLTGLPAGSVLSAGTSSDGGATWTFNGPAPGYLTMTPPPNFSGAFTLTVTATTSQGSSTATSTGTVSVTVSAVQDAPVVANPIADQSAAEDQPFSFTVPSNAFADADVGDVLTYTATLVNGDPLPSWLSFDAPSRTFSGTPDNDDVAAFDVRVMATDGLGASVSDDFEISVAGIAAAPTISFSEAVRVESIERVSTNSSGGQVNGLTAGNTLFSPDDTKVVFVSLASDLVSGDTNATYDVFVKNIVTGEMTLVSTDANGVQGNFSNAVSGTVPLFTPDGTKVAFASFATNLVPGDNNGFPDFFLKDLETGAVTRFSTDANGVEGNNTIFGVPIFSADGTKVLFTSLASNLVTGDTNGFGDVFVKNLVTGAVLRVSTDSNGIEGNNSAFQAGSTPPRFLPDETKVLFENLSSNLVPDDTNNASDIFIKNLTTGEVTRISTGASGTEANGGSQGATISPDGTKVMFRSAASNLVDGDTNGVIDVFIKDLTTNAITRISTGANGEQGTADTFNPHFSPDGTKVVFQSASGNFVEGDTNGFADLFVKDLATGAVTRVSTDETGVLGNANSRLGFFSFDGKMIGFNSDASNLVPGDTNAVPDAFVARISTPFKGAEDGAIRLPIGVASVEAGETVTQVVLTGLPAGSVLSAGTSIDNGLTWTFSGPPPADLTLTPPVNYAGTFTLTVTATATQGGSTTTATGTHAVTISPVGDAATISFESLSPIDAADVLVNTTTTNTQAHPAVAALPDGGHVVVWTSVVSPANGDPVTSLSDIRMQRYDAAGAPVGSEFVVNSTAPGVANHILPGITALADGGFVVTWTLYVSPENNEVWLRRFDAGGAPVGNDFPMVFPFSPGLDGISNVTALPDGGFLVSWDEWNETDRDVAFQIYNAANAKVGGRVQINQDGIGYSFNDFVDIAVLEDGGFVAVWETSPEANFDDLGRIYIRRFDSSGAPLGDAAQLTSDTLHPESLPTVTSLVGGGFVAGWTSFDREGVENGTDAYVQRFDASGARVGSETLVYADPAGGQGYLTMQGLADGGFVATYTQGSAFSRTGLATGTEDIFAQRFDAAGNRVGEPVRLNATTDGTQFSQTWASDPNMVVTTDGVLIQTFYGDGDIHLRRFDTRVFEGEVDGSINLPIKVTPVAGETVTSVVLSNLPLGSILSAGTSSDGGATWTFSGPPPADLSMTGPEGYFGAFTLTVTATSTQGSVSTTSTANNTVTIAAVNVAPPLIIDLDRDGVHLQSGVAFDFDGDGVLERGGWASSRDAFLAIDRNHDGTINGIGEISFVGDLPGAMSDLEGLRAFDSNSDRVLSSADLRFGEFSLWQDANSNGISEAGELRSLGDVGVVSISLERADASSTLNGGTILGYATVTFLDGSINYAADTLLGYSEVRQLPPMSADIVETTSSFIPQARALIHDSYMLGAPGGLAPQYSQRVQDGEGGEKRSMPFDEELFGFANGESGALADHGAATAARELRPQPFEAELLEDAAFDFSALNASEQPYTGVRGGNQFVDFDWMDQHKLDGHDVLPEYTGEAARDFHTQYMLEDATQGSIDGTPALAVDLFSVV